MVTTPDSPHFLSTTFDTKLGPIHAGAIADRLVFLYFTEVEEQKTPLSQVIEKRFDRTPIQGSSPVFQTLKEELKNYFEGSLKRFTVPIVPIGTDFELSVWKQLLQIPYGKTVSYKTIAENLKTPRKVRPIGQAIGRNPLSVLIPCHRVIGSNGSLTGYAGGLSRKAFLLKLENALDK